MSGDCLCIKFSCILLSNFLSSPVNVKAALLCLSVFYFSQLWDFTTPGESGLVWSGDAQMTYLQVFYTFSTK